jgi:acyl-CoA synthetase (AMP-forming)/AMP-acid ligase II
MYRKSYVYGTNTPELTTMDFSVPQEVPPDVGLQLMRLVKDFHDGYLTEKGYTKRRFELLHMSSGHQPQNGDTESSVGSTVYSDSLHIPLTSVQSRGSVPTSAGLSEDFYEPSSHRFSHSIDGSSNSRSAFYDEDALQKYNNLVGHHSQDIRKELQKPLDPRDITSHVEADREFDNLAMILRKRARMYEKEPAVLVVDEKGREDKIITWDKLYYRAEKIAKQIKNKAALYPGDRVCLIYQNVEVIDFMVAIFGCFLSGVVAVPLNSSIPTRELVSIMNDTQSHLCLMSDSVSKHFEKVSKQSKASVWPKGMAVWRTTDMGVYKPSKKDGDPPLKISDLAYIDYTRGLNGEMKGVVISHRTILSQMKMLDQMLSTSPDIKAPLVRSTLKQTSARNNILSTLDVRGSIGMIMSILFSVYSGNLFVWVYHKTAEVPGLLANVLSSYRTSVFLTDYYVLKSVVYNYQSFPQNTRTFSKRKVDLSSIKWCLIDTHSVDCEFNEILSDRWLKPLGSKHPKRVVTPFLSLHEHGGAIVTMRDWYGHEDQLGCIFNQSSQNDDIDDEFGDNDSSDKLAEILIDKESLSTNSVKIINDSPPPVSSSENKADSDYVRVGAFGYPVPDATLALVNPETKILSGVSEVGEIWVDSNCISGGYWGLIDDTQQIFQAECSDYEGILSLKFVRTGLLGFIYNGMIYVLGLYEDRVNQRVTWYDQYLSLSTDENNNDSTGSLIKKPENGHSRNVSAMSDMESFQKSQKKKNNILSEKIDLTENLQNKFVYKYHYSVHLVKTLAKYLPYFKDGSFFNLKVNREYLPVGIIESGLSTDTSKSAQVELQSMITEAFDLLEKHHNIRLFFIVITKSGSLSRSLKSGRLEIANTLTKRRFLEGYLPSVYVAFRPYNSLGTIFHGEDLKGGIWSPYSTSLRGDLLSYATTQSSGLDKRDATVDYRSRANLVDFKSFYQLLEFRANKQADELAYAQLEGLVIKENKQLTTWQKFENRVFSVCSYILEKKVLSAGDVVVLMYPLCEEYLGCLYACWMAGLVVIPMEPFGKDIQSAGEDAEMLVNLIKEYNVQAIFVNNETESAFKNKPVSSKMKELSLKFKITIPKLRNTSKHSKASSNGKSTYKKMEQYRCKQKTSKLSAKTCMIWLSISPDSEYTAAQVTHKNLLHACLSLKETCQMNSIAPIVGCAKYTAGLGFLFSGVLGVYLGATTYLMSTNEYGFHCGTFFQALERYRVENAYLDYRMLTYALDRKAIAKINLKNMRNLMLTYEDCRADPLLHVKYKELLEMSNIKAKAISHVYDHQMNPLVSTRSFLSFEPTILWLDPHALSQGYISIVNPKDSPQAIPVVDSGVVSVNTEVVIVNPQTEKLCKIGEFGEIWVSSDNTLDAYAGKDDNASNKEFLKGKLSINGNTYLRTGDFGFLHTVSKTEKNSMVEMQLLYNLGKIDETFEYCGLQFFAKDIEHCMETFDGISRCCVFKAGDFTVLIAAITTKRSLSTITPLMILKVLNKFKIVIDIVSFVDGTGLSPSKNGELQRCKIAQKWMNRSLRTNATFGVSYGENEMIKAIQMQDWVEDKLLQ